jgi:hypothetical protein
MIWILAMVRAQEGEEMKDEENNEKRLKYILI